MSWFLALIAAWIVLLLLQKQAPKWGAKKLTEVSKQLEVTSRELQVVEAASFPDLDLAWYDSNRSFMVERGFVHLEDVIDVLLARQRPSVRAFVRVLVSADGVTVGALYHFRETGWLRFMMPKKLSDVRVCDLETEFSDGTFLCTTNAPSFAAFDYGGMIRSRPVPSSVVADLLESHAASVAEVLNEKPTLRATVSHTVEDVRAFANRMQYVKGTYRRGLSKPFSEAELNTISEGKYQREAAQVTEEFDKTPRSPSDR